MGVLSILSLNIPDVIALRRSLKALMCPLYGHSSPRNSFYYFTCIAADYSDCLGFSRPLRAESMPIDLRHVGPTPYPLPQPLCCMDMEGRHI